MEERIQKIIAASGITSRRGAEQLILDGKVKLNGEKVRVLGTKANPEIDEIKVDGKVLPKHISSITYLVNKPKGVVVSKTRQGDSKIITDLLPLKPAVYPVGRLDKDSEGLILMTNNGELAHKLTHPSFEHKKEYLVTVKWEKDSKKDVEWVRRHLEKGMKLGDGNAKADKLDIKVLPNDTLSLFITIHEGRHHLIRRMCATVSLEVIKLKRTKLSFLTLGNLNSGQYRILTHEEVARLG